MSKVKGKDSLKADTHSRPTAVGVSMSETRLCRSIVFRADWFACCKRHAETARHQMRKCESHCKHQPSVGESSKTSQRALSTITSSPARTSLTHRRKEIRSINQRCRSMDWKSASAGWCTRHRLAREALRSQRAQLLADVHFETDTVQISAPLCTRDVETLPLFETSKTRKSNQWSPPNGDRDAGTPLARKIGAGSLRSLSAGKILLCSEGR